MLAKTDFINYRWSVMRARYSSVSVSQLASTSTVLEASLK